MAFEQKIRNFLSSLCHRGIEGRFFNGTQHISQSSTYKRKIHPNRTPFRSKKSRSCFTASQCPLRMRCSFWRKIRKIIFRPLINPSGQEQAYWPKTFEKYVSHYLATAEGIFCRGSRKKSKKISPPAEKICEKAARY